MTPPLLLRARTGAVSLALLLGLLVPAGLQVRAQEAPTVQEAATPAPGGEAAETGDAGDVAEVGEAVERILDAAGEPDAASAARASIDVAAAAAEREALPRPEALRTALRPLRLEALEAQVEKMIARIAEVDTQLAELEIEARDTEGDAKVDILARATALRDLKAALIERAEVALTALDAKGGDSDQARLYLKAISGIELDTSDVSGAWITVRQWITSPEGGIKWGLNVVQFLVLLLAFWILARIVGSILSAALSRSKNASSLLKAFLVGLTRKVIVLIGLVVAAGALGVNVTPVVAAIGAAGLVIGLALQGTLSNFASGILILLYRPFDVGDAVTAGGVTGKVEAMSLMSSTFSTFDNQVMIVPNNEIWNGVITNITGRDTRRVDMTFGISYADDIDKARQLLLDIVSSHPKTLDDPAPVVKLHEMADSSVNFVVRPWSKTSDYWDVLWDVTAEVKRRFDAEGISIPFPQRDVHVYQVERKPTATADTGQTDGNSDGNVDGHGDAIGETGTRLQV
ncbi:MAG: mechanosensitive ion channel domain-containing protein [Phycisphaerae bacterium]